MLREGERMMIETSGRPTGRRGATKKTLPAAPKVEADQWYAYPECAAVLRISLPTLYVWIRAGYLEPTRVRRRSFILGSELMRFMTSKPKAPSRAA